MPPDELLDHMTTVIVVCVVIVAVLVLSFGIAVAVGKWINRGQK